jgi:hypothetical protein
MIKAIKTLTTAAVVLCGVGLAACGVSPAPPAATPKSSASPAATPKLTDFQQCVQAYERHMNEDARQVVPDTPACRLIPLGEAEYGALNDAAQDDNPATAEPPADPLDVPGSRAAVEACHKAQNAFYATGDYNTPIREIQKHGTATDKKDMAAFSRLCNVPPLSEKEFLAAVKRHPS